MNGLDGITFKGRFGLTEREADCADLAIRGARSTEIAQRMGYANAQVVRNTMTRIFDRIGVRNRTELLIVGVFGRRGLEVEERQCRS
jgi:DNA-binding CsgD family transcriptional regulator